MKRRSFLTQSGTALGGSWITMSLPAALAATVTACKAREEGNAFKVLSAAEAVEFAAIAAQIIPSGPSPGATEAGVIYFMDIVLAGNNAEVLQSMRQGLAELQDSIKRSYNKESFASLGNSRQIEVLQGIDETDFFGTVRHLTLAGTFSNSSYGGNRDNTGWQLIGFEGPRPTQPPFGHYDADYIKKGK